MSESAHLLYSIKNDNLRLLEMLLSNLCTMICWFKSFLAFVCAFIRNQIQTSLKQSYFHSQPTFNNFCGLRQCTCTQNARLPTRCVNVCILFRVYNTYHIHWNCDDNNDDNNHNSCITSNSVCSRHRRRRLLLPPSCVFIFYLSFVLALALNLSLGFYFCCRGSLIRVSI